MNTGKRVIDLSLIPNNINPRIYVSQYDVGVTLTFNWSGTLAAGGAARVMGTKPSGIGFDLACTRVGSGTSVTGFTVETTLDMTSEAGEFPAEIRITEGTQVVGSQNFTLVVERSPHPDGTIDGYEEGRTIIETVTGLVNDAEESASEAATSATAAAQSASAAAQSATSAAADAESADASAARAMATTPEGYEEFVTELLANQNGGWVRKNLLKNTANSTGNFTVNSDGTVTVNGSFTSQTNLNIGTIRFDEDTRVILNGAPAGGGTSSYALFISGKGTDSGSGATFTLNAGVTYTVVLRLYAGYTANNLVIKPMVRPATIEDSTYVPYAPSNSALNADLLKSLTYNRGDSFSLFLKTAVIVSSPTVFRFQIPLNKPFGSTITSDSNLSVTVGSATLFQSAGSYAVAASDIASVAAVRRTIAIEVTVTLSAAISGLTAARATTGDINLTVNFT